VTTSLVLVVCPVCQQVALWDDSPRVCTVDGAALLEVKPLDEGPADEPEIVEVDRG